MRALTASDSSATTTGPPTASGTWTPTLNNFTIVNGTGSVTATGTYVKIGHLVWATCQISPSGTATSACVAGTSFVSGLPYLPATTSAGSFVLGGETSGGQAVFYSNSGNGDIAPTAWSAVNVAIYITGVYSV